MSSLTLLPAKARAALADPGPVERQILSKLDDVLARMEEGRLRVAVLGQFKRGKSTLLNAFLGTPLLPAGIRPVTAIPTYIRARARPMLRIEFGEPGEPIEFCDASEFPAALAKYVSEAENPGNRKRVRRVEIAVDSATFSERVILVDTPGVGSTFVHNSRAAEAVLGDCDVGIFVVSPDPPITEVELAYLAAVRGLVPKIVFVLNKIDLLAGEERSIALSFLAGVLAADLGPGKTGGIYPVSAKQALLAKLSGDRSALASTGLPELERALADELATEERAIAFATGRSRATALVEELLYLRELGHKALLMPEQSLTQKIAEFEQIASRFESERRNLSDYLSVDRRRLLAEITAMTDEVWSASRTKFADLAKDETQPGFNEREARERLGKALEEHFEAAVRQTTQQARAELTSRLATYEAQAGDLLGRVRRASADLMEISVTLPAAERAFEARRESYWVAPGPPTSILGVSADMLAKVMPRRVRERGLRRQIVADTEKAALRNVANLDWALRQNVEEAFRHFESDSEKQLLQALEETRQAMHIALQKRSARSAESASLVAQNEQAIARLSTALEELERGPDVEARTRSMRRNS